MASDRFSSVPSLSWETMVDSTLFTERTVTVGGQANTLTVEVLVRVLTAALMERQIVLISESKERRTAVAFCLVALLEAGGCEYRHTFLPLVPPDLYPVLEAPTPCGNGRPLSQLPS